MRLLLDVSAVPARPVGAGVYTVALAHGLAEPATGVELHLLARRSDRSRWVELVPTATVHAVAPDARPARLAWEQASAPGVARTLGIDVWHGPHYTMPLRLPVPAVVTIHDLTFLEHPEWHERSKVLFFGRMLRESARRAAALVCVSHFTADRLEALTRPAGAIVVAPHGVDHHRFRPDPHGLLAEADASLLAAHGVTPPYLGFAGTIEPRKDLPTLVEAFAHLAPDHPDLRLVLAGGDGWGAETLRAAVAGSGVATRVLRPGYLPDAAVPALYRRAQVVAYPSLTEGFGLPVLEALACGAAVVSTTGSAVEEVARDAALLVAPGDGPALRSALVAAMAPPLATRLREAGPARAAEFTWERSVAAHLDAYRQAALEARG